MEKVIACIDLKAFYASVECVERGLDPFTTPLVVCDTSRGMGTIILAVTPYMKKLGIPSRLRRKELPHIKGTIFATPRMQLYIEKSCEIVSILLEFVAEEDIHVYSIDESFVNLGPYLDYYHKTADEIVADIQKRIKEKTGLTATAGISYNMFMAKIAMDNEGKNLAPNYRTTWTKEDIEKKLWKIHPIEKVWGISAGYKKRLEQLGINSIEKLAKAPKDYLIYNFGIIGEQLHDLANGIDDSDIREKYIPMATSFSAGHSLYKDYSKEDTKLLIREVSDSLCKRLHASNKSTKLISLTIIYTFSSKITGFSQQAALDMPTDNNDVLYRNLMKIFDANIQDIGVRKVYICFGKLCDASIQYNSLFEDDFEASFENRTINITIEQIQEKYGPESISRASAKLDKSVYSQRANQIGGHKR